MFTIKWQNNTGDWFESATEYRFEANNLYQWKKTGGVAKLVEFWEDDVLVSFWDRSLA